MFKNKNLILSALSIVLLGGLLLIYSNHWSNEFHLDDFHTITDNPFIRSLNNTWLFFTDGKSFSNLPSNQSYRPLVSLSLALDYSITNSYNLFYFHLSTFIWFILQGIFTFFLFKKILDQSLENKFNGYIALFMSALFAYHTAVAETVNYIISRGDLLSTVFGIISLWMFIKFKRKYYLYLIPFLLAVFTKPPGLMFLPIALVYVLLFEKKESISLNFFAQKTRKIWLQIIMENKLFILVAIAAYAFNIYMTPETFTPGGSSRGLYVLTQLYVTLHYFISFFIPHNLSVDTDMTLVKSAGDPKVILGFIGNILLIYFAIKQSRKKESRPISFGIAWFYLSLIPTALIPLAEVMNDHRMYFPFVGLSLAMVWFVFLKLRSIFTDEKKLILISSISAVLILCSFGYSTFERNKVWATEESVWFDCTKKSPKNGRGLMNYGVVKMSQGDYETAKTSFNRALRYTPFYPALYVNLAIVNNALGDVATAETQFKRALELDPNYPSGHYFYGEYLRKKGSFNEAIAEYKSTLQLTSSDIKSLEGLMDVYNTLMNAEELINTAKKTLSLDPNNVKAKAYENGIVANPQQAKVVEIADPNAPKTAEYYLGLSLTYYNSGDYLKCIEACREAIKINPTFSEAYNNICAAYNMLKKFKEAAEAGKSAVALNPNNQLAKNNLAYSVSMLK